MGQSDELLIFGHCICRVHLPSLRASSTLVSSAQTQRITFAWALLQARRIESSCMHGLQVLQ